MFRILSALLLFIPAVALAIEDPTRPPTKKQAAAPVQRAATPRLTAILVGPERRVATINSRVMTEGERRGGITLERIDSDSVIVRTAGRRLTLSLASKNVVKEAK